MTKEDVLEMLECLIEEVRGDVTEISTFEALNIAYDAVKVYNCKEFDESAAFEEEIADEASFFGDMWYND